MTPLARRAGRALLWMGVEATGMKGISLVRTLVLARILVPDDFGLVAIGLVSVEAVMALTNFGMTEALVQKARTEDRDYHTAWTFELARGVAVAAVMLVAAPLIASHLFDEPRATNIIRVLALTPIVDHVASIKVFERMRRLQFRPQATVSLAGTLTHTIVSISLAPSVGVWGFVAGVLAGALAQSVVSYVLAPFRPRLSFDRDAARPLFRFGRGIFARENLRVLADVLLKAIIARRLGVEALGLYFLAARLAFLPREIVRNVASRVTFSVHARLQFDAERAKVAFRASLRGMAALLAPVSAVVLVTAPELVAQFLGSVWVDTVPVIRLLTIVGVLGIAADATVPLLDGRGRTIPAAGLSALRAAVVLPLIWYLCDLFGLAGAGWAWLGGELVVLTSCAVVAGRLLPDSHHGLTRSLIAILAASAGGALAAFGLSRWWLEPAGLVAALVAGLGLSALILGKLDRWAGTELFRHLDQAFPRVARRLQNLRWRRAQS